MHQPVRQVLPADHRAFGLGSMTAALVIVPHSGPRVAGGIHAVPGELPWMVRLSTARGEATDTSQRLLTALPCVGSTGCDSPRSRAVANVPAYRLTSKTF